MKEKQLFPCDTARFARMMLRENDDGQQEYVIQSEYSRKTHTYESELTIPVSSPTAELEAWNAYIGALDTAVNKILRTRAKIKMYIAELVRESIPLIVPTVFEIKKNFDEQFQKMKQLLGEEI